MIRAVTRAVPRVGGAVAVLGMLAGCGQLLREEPDPAAPANPRDIELTVFLIGDAGAPAPDEPVLNALTRQVTEATGEPVIVYLGDNIYPAGLPDSGALGRAEAERRLNAQVDVGRRTGARTFFVPGNHDWGYMGPGGWNAIRRQAAYIRRRGGARIRMLPDGGCPGPEVADFGTRARIIFLDTQWWLHDYIRPADPGSECGTDSPQEIMDSLAGALIGANERHSIVVAHHPMRSGGKHGGHFGWQPHIFPLRSLKRWLWVPLPILGSYVPLARKQGLSDQDIAANEYQRMLRAFETVFDEYPPLMYAAGHDHDMQVIKGESARWVVVSGSGIYGHVSEVDHIPGTRFAGSVSGFMRLDFLRDGQVRLGVIGVDVNAASEELFSTYLEE